MSVNPPEVSVVIIVRNGAETIRRQLDALAAQEDAPSFEVIVVDNGSTDETVEIFRRWQEEVSELPIATALCRAHDKASIPYARNQGILAAKGRIVAFCDADDAVHPGWVRAVSALTSGIAGGRILAIRPDGTPEHNMFPGLTATNYLPHVGGCNMAMVREDVVSVGGFDESLPRYGCDDVDISWRMQEAGLPLAFLPDAAVDFYLTPSTRAVKKTFQNSKARMAVALRYPRSTQSNPPTMSQVTAVATREVALLPWRLLRPRGFPRTKLIRSAVTATGRVAGYWTYGVRRLPPQYGVGPE